MDRDHDDDSHEEEEPKGDDLMAEDVMVQDGLDRGERKRARSPTPSPSPIIPSQFHDWPAHVFCSPPTSIFEDDGPSEMAEEGSEELEGSEGVGFIPVPCIPDRPYHEYKVNEECTHICCPHCGSVLPLRS